MKKVLVVADDITGADDIGIMYRKSGHRTALYPYHSCQKAEFENYSKLVVDTDSRYVSPKESYERVKSVVNRLKDCSLDLVFSKQCSVFRGNVGYEFDAVLDALGLEFAPVIAAFPDNGRTTINGLHYVYGTLLEESQFSKDPVNPMKESRLERIVGDKTKRKVSSIYYTEYSKGLDYLKKVLEEKRAEGGYLIFDARDNEDLKLIAKLLENEKVICGSSAIAYYLGLLDEDKDLVESPIINHTVDKVLCIAGSLTKETFQQMEYLQEKNCPMSILNVNSVCLDDLNSEIDRNIEFAKEAYKIGKIFVLRTPNGAKAIEKTIQDTGLDRTVVATKISTSLATIALRISQEFDIQNIIVCGGDTSDAFCRIFGIEGIEVGEEIESGVSVCTKIGDENLKFVMKSGSFGSPAFIEKAVKVLNGGVDVFDRK